MEGLFVRAHQRVRPGYWNLAPGQDAPAFRLRVRALPRYLIDRITVRRAFKRQTEIAPWITADALQILEGLLQPDDVGVEFGSGGSTTWFAARVGHLHSVEANPRWHADVESRIADGRVQNVSYHLAAGIASDHGTPQARDSYVNFAPDLEPESQDFVFIDGEYRDECALRALDLVRPGGAIILDNANTYLPNASRSPWKVDGPATGLWQEFVERTAGWRSMWTTNGVWDTAFWIRPGSSDAESTAAESGEESTGEHTLDELEDSRLSSA
jgi:predicted O-methyltransferase YrrM